MTAEEQPVLFGLPCDGCGVLVTFNCDSEKTALQVIDAWLDSEQPAYCTACRALPHSA